MSQRKALSKRLLEASKTGCTDDVRALVANKRALLQTDFVGNSALHLAVLAGHLDTAKVLLDAGLAGDVVNHVGRTPLHHAADNGHVNIVDLLVKYDADVQAQDMLQMTPLHWAAERGHARVVELLVNAGADINCVNRFNKTPLDIANDNGHEDIIHFLSITREIVFVNPTTDVEERITLQRYVNISTPATKATTYVANPTSGDDYDGGSYDYLFPGNDVAVNEQELEDEEEDSAAVLQRLSTINSLQIAQLSNISDDYYIDYSAPQTKSAVSEQEHQEEDNATVPDNANQLQVRSPIDLTGEDD